MLRQLVPAETGAQSQEAVLIWANLKTEPQTKTWVHTAEIQESGAKEEGMCETRRKASKGCLMTWLPPWTARAQLLRGLCEEPYREDASELAHQRMDTYPWHAHCVSGAPRGVNFSTKMCLSSDFGECSRKEDDTIPAASLAWTAGNAESGGPRGWDPASMTFTKEVKPTGS